MDHINSEDWGDVQEDNYHLFSMAFQSWILGVCRVCILQGKHCYQWCFLQQAFSGMLCVTLRVGLPETGIRAEVQQSIIRDKVCCQNSMRSNGTPSCALHLELQPAIQLINPPDVNTTRDSLPSMLSVCNSKAQSVLCGWCKEIISLIQMMALSLKKNHKVFMKDIW